ncbi:hypothetical protein [Massilia sp. BJB1822]|uniref:hypothetical protein n=1 Tax=Massilia sp. BJB1822 TaxID=2744470 RepID=UPI0015947BA0|nr:hypothetical protein [Massilia sp. BJB1822]NVD97931.1 hypothetical protein [Massilia sp. BJB1822]
MSAHLKSFASTLAGQITSQNPLYSDLKSGVFLHGATRLAIKTFLRDGLGNALRVKGAQVVFLDLNPGTQEISLAEVLAEIWGSLEDNGGKPCPNLLPDAVRAVTRSGKALAILLDGIDHKAPQKEHEALFKALKAARDASNLWGGEQGPLLLVVAGTCKERLLMLTSDRNEAFYCATMLTIPDG